MEPWNGNIEMIDPRIILVDHLYQRQEKQRLIDAIASSPKWEAFGTITVFTRKRAATEDGRERLVYYCVDGQQRLKGVLSHEKPPPEVPCVVFQLEGVREEAEMFVRINEFRISLSALEKHTGKVVAKDPAAVAIERVADRVGLTIGNAYSDYSSPNTIQAVGSLNHVYNLIGEEGLEQTLVQCRDAWPHDRAAISAVMIHAVGNLIAEYQSAENGSGYNRAKLTKALALTTPAVLMRKAESFRFDMGGSRQVNMRRALKALCKL